MGGPGNPIEVESVPLVKPATAVPNLVSTPGRRTRLIRSQDFEYLRTGDEADEGERQQREYGPPLDLLPGIRDDRKGDEDAQDDHDGDHRRRFVEEQHSRHQDQSQPEPRQP
jgi:hypothetical protein